MFPIDEVKGFKCKWNSAALLSFRPIRRVTSEGWNQFEPRCDSPRCVAPSRAGKTNKRTLVFGGVKSLFRSCPPYLGSCYRRWMGLCAASASLAVFMAGEISSEAGRGASSNVFQLLNHHISWSTFSKFSPGNWLALVFNSTEVLRRF